MIGVIVSNGAIINLNGLDIEALHQHHVKHHTVQDFPGGTFVQDGAQVLEMECDILILAALEAQTENPRQTGSRRRKWTDHL